MRLGFGIGDAVHGTFSLAMSYGGKAKKKHPIGCSSASNRWRWPNATAGPSRFLEAGAPGPRSRVGRSAISAAVRAAWEHRGRWTRRAFWTRPGAGSTTPAPRRWNSQARRAQRLAGCVGGGEAGAGNAGCWSVAANGFPNPRPKSGACLMRSVRRCTQDAWVGRMGAAGGWWHRIGGNFRHATILRAGPQDHPACDSAVAGDRSRRWCGGVARERGRRGTHAGARADGGAPSRQRRPAGRGGRRRSPGSSDALARAAAGAATAAMDLSPVRSYDPPTHPGSAA